MLLSFMCVIDFKIVMHNVFDIDFHTDADKCIYTGQFLLGTAQCALNSLTVITTLNILLTELNCNTYIWPSYPAKK